MKIIYFFRGRFKKKLSTIFVLGFFLFFIEKMQAQVGVTSAHRIFFQYKKEIKMLKKIEQKNDNALKVSPIPLAYCYQNLAFFCKLEVKWDKVNVAPVRFRLGSVEYANGLEGK
jgi:hypothetical protein